MSSDQRDLSLGNALSTSLGSEETVDALATIADMGIDAAISSGALDGVPIVGAATGLWRAGREVQHELFIRKIARFLQGLSKATAAERQHFLEELRRDGKTERFGEAILLILERLDEASKPTIIGRIMAAHVQGHLTYDQAMRLAAIVSRCYAQDLEYLKKFKPGTQREMTVFADALFSAGLLRDGGLDGGTLGDALSGGTIYDLNEYGKLLVRFGLTDIPA